MFEVFIWRLLSNTLYNILTCACVHLKIQFAQFLLTMIHNTCLLVTSTKGVRIQALFRARSFLRKEQWYHRDRIEKRGWGFFFFILSCFCFSWLYNDHLTAPSFTRGFSIFRIKLSVDLLKIQVET